MQRQKQQQTKYNNKKQQVYSYYGEQHIHIPYGQHQRYSTDIILYST